MQKPMSVQPGTFNRLAEFGVGTRRTTDRISSDGAWTTSLPLCDCHSESRSVICSVRGGLSSSKDSTSISSKIVVDHGIEGRIRCTEGVKLAVTAAQNRAEQAGIPLRSEVPSVDSDW
jgi:hypothetical protein